MSQRRHAKSRAHTQQRQPLPGLTASVIRQMASMSQTLDNPPSLIRDRDDEDDASEVSGYQGPEHEYGYNNNWTKFV